MQPSLIYQKIHTIRGLSVMMDYDLAELYETETRVLKQAVNRNIERFPGDFMFQLTKDEHQTLRSQVVILNKPAGRGQHSKYLPYAFTEHGVAMLSSVLKNERAIQANIFIIRTFVLSRQFALSYSELTKEIKSLEKKYDQSFQEVFKALEYLLKQKSNEEDFTARTRIGFKKS